MCKASALRFGKVLKNDLTHIYILELEDYRLKDANHVVLGAIFSRRKHRP